MKKLLFLISILGFAESQAQMFFSTGSSMYVGDQFVYVKQDVNLQNNSTILLRRGGQLIQGTTGTSTNQGQGKLSVFQEGNVDNFEYNYWCSPIGNASAGSGNENFGVTMLNRPNGVSSSVPATILPMASLNSTTDNLDLPTSLSIAPRWVFRYLSGSNYSGWFTLPTGNATVIEPGQGFTMKGTSGTDDFFSENAVDNNPGAAQRYDFRGKPNDGNIPITVGLGKMTLTGNPYPSSINLRAFLLAQTNCTGVAYFWEQDKNVNSHVLQNYQGGYGSYAAGSNLYLAPTFYGYNSSGTQLGWTGSGTNYPREFSPVGQGFMIEGTTNGTVTMSNTYRIFKREGVDTAFSRQSAPGNSNEAPEDYVGSEVTPHIKLNIWLDDYAIRQLLLSFSPVATDGVDRAWDAKSGGGGTSDSYFPMEGNEYSIAAVNFDINKKVPIAFKNAANQNFKITVAGMVNFSDAEHVYLHDKVTDEYHEISGSTYEFSAPTGNDLTRYEITFVSNSLGVPTLDQNAFEVVQNNDMQQLQISNPQLIDIKSCSLYDMTGRLIFSKTKLNTEASYSFSTAGLSDGVYIVKIVSGKGQDFGRKVSIVKKNN